MADPFGGVALNGVLALGDFTVTEPPGSTPGLLIFIPHPLPNKTIKIYRSICRIHLIGDSVDGIYATTLFLVRASDFSIIGGCATDIRGPVHRNSPAASDWVADRDIDHSPNYFELKKDDHLFGVYRTWGTPSTNGHLVFKATLDILYSYSV